MTLEIRQTLAFAGGRLELPHEYVGSVEIRSKIARFREGIDYDIIPAPDNDTPTRAVWIDGGLIPFDAWLRIQYVTDGQAANGAYRFDAEGEIGLPSDASDIQVSPTLAPQFEIDTDYTLDARFGAAYRSLDSRIGEDEIVDVRYVVGGITETEASDAIAFDTDQTEVQLNHAPIWNVAILGYVEDVDYAVDYRGGCILRVEGSGIEDVTQTPISYRFGMPFVYITPQDYERANEDPNLSQENYVAVWEAAEHATASIDGYLRRAGGNALALPLAPKNFWAKAIALKFLRLELQQYNSEDIKYEYEQAISQLENYVSGASALTDDIAETPRKPRAASSRNYFGGLGEVYRPGVVRRIY
ncbi:MAG: DUF1320 family protein [Cyanobacteria bacterium SBC]|nr:DUF1320 family protein [Cyanobacteria bacterium SBC]